MLTDIYKVLAKFNNDPKVGPNKVYNKIGAPTLIVKDYNQASSDIKTFFNSELSQLINRFKRDVGHDQQGFFNLYEGLNKTMQANLVARDCHGLLADRKKFPAISGWFSPNSNIRDNHIETECQQVNADNNTKRPVKARYYYTYQGTNADANDVANVLGVPVAMHYVKTREPFNNDSYTNESPPSGSHFIFAAPKLVAFNNDSSAGKINGVVPQKDIKDQNYVLHPYRYQPWHFEATGGRGSGETWIAFRDKDGVNAVVMLKMYFAGFQLSCVTEDCRVEKKEWLSFSSGLNVDLSDLKKPQHNSPVYQLGPL